MPAECERQYYGASIAYSHVAAEVRCAFPQSRWRYWPLTLHPYGPLSAPHAVIVPGVLSLLRDVAPASIPRKRRAS